MNTVNSSGRKAFGYPQANIQQKIGPIVIKRQIFQKIYFPDLRTDDVIIMTELIAHQELFRNFVIRNHEKTKTK
ncbi:MAG: hypothetical protein J5565_06375 [Muribaculaceae bacterium]|nr:hypothetical protein [Muribaculaceae bacterium]